MVKHLWDWTKSIVIAIILSVLITAFLLQPFRVSGHSMDPSLQDEQRIFVSKINHTLRNYDSYNYGDIVIIDSRVNEPRGFWNEIEENPILLWVESKFFDRQGGHDLWVKRIIGKPGDKLEFMDGILYRNGTKIDEPYIKEKMMINIPSEPIEVPEDHLFVMGDNRNNSRDSRMIGSIPIDHVLGVKLF
ncbi:signal peptidase I [Ammoniphilus resinae]|uniref:Signal peptidase I n=1 Tax=Ammoniphilus resinae TaxID=861532 RepID=A0ABS4GN99_9BACL|nr:signal peptidase I [Ammoniphilus resinae]MBP1931744.1 signal peptidase I [Ammoniphilus resinae]